jgi:MOSC domain-containing protein YiiM/ferredoxin-NADP reductase
MSIPRLVAVNVGLPQDVPWRGRTVHTGVFKHPVDGPQMVRTLNIDGDGQGDLGGHGGPHRAVMVYQLGSYAYWRAELGRDDLEHGQFGENFTVDGLPDDQVCIGDRLRIGEALFEVSQPRVTCYRVGMRMNEPRLPALLVSHHRPGFYLRVLREGVVQAGDEIGWEQSGPERMTVAEVDALLYLPGHDRTALARARRLPALSPGWQGSFAAMLDSGGATGNVGLTDAAAAAPVAWPGFRSLRVVDVEPESDTVRSLRLASIDGTPLPAALPGQFVAVRIAMDTAGTVATRSYSLSGPIGAPDYRISVKRETHGVVSGFVYSTVRADAIVDVAAPRGGFVLRDGGAPVLLISAGIGATPVLAMLHALADSGSRREVWWLHGARNSAEHPFAAEVRDLLARLPHARAEICYSAPLPTDQIGSDYTRRGHLAADVLQHLGIPTAGQAYVCGPQRFMDDIRSSLEGLGLAPGQIATEVFGAGAPITPGISAGPVVRPHQPPGDPGSGPEISFARSGLTTTWQDGAGSLLEFAEACDVPTRWSCRTGICHTCETGLLAGSVSYDPSPIDLPADGNVLICCATPRQDLVLDL